jgi:endonuclease YncB( thermonuclease family)
MPGSACFAQSEVITGEARVIDSDVLDFDGQRVMLYGLESVERGQTCSIEGTMWECYPAAVRQLETLADLGPVTCEQVEVDMYRRWLAYCEVGGESLNEAFVASGFAVARPDETDRFVAAEKAAEAAKIGLWQGEFQRPADYRTAAGILVDRP